MVHGGTSTCVHVNNRGGSRRVRGGVSGSRSTRGRIHRRVRSPLAYVQKEGSYILGRRRSGPQWWRNAKIGGLSTTSHVHHLWRPSASENNFMSRNLAEPVAGARLCCARAPAHRHVAPRTSFSKGQKDCRKIGTESLEPFEPLRGGASDGPRDSVPIIAVLELTSLCPLRPPAGAAVFLHFLVAQFAF